MRTKDLHREAARRAAAEETLRQSQKMEAIGQLTGGIAHDFNNLLTVIIGNLDIALRKCADAALERPLRNALIGGQRAAQLTQKLLAFSRRQPLSPRPVDANRLIAGMSDLLRRSLGEKIDIETVGRRGPVADRGRRRRARGGAPQSRDQRPRRHAGRRQADDRDDQCAPRRGLRPHSSTASKPASTS